LFKTQIDHLLLKEGPAPRHDNFIFLKYLSDATRLWTYVPYIVNINTSPKIP